MKTIIMYIRLAEVLNLPEDINNLPPIRIVRESKTRHRTIGLEQITEVVLELEPDLEQHSEYIPFRVEIWDANEPDAPPIEERRRTKRERDSGVGSKISDKCTTPNTPNLSLSQEQGGVK